MRRRTFVEATAGLLGVGTSPWPRWPRSNRAPTGTPFLDAHAHVNSPRLADVAERAYQKRVIEPLDGAEVVRRLDAAGIRKAVVHATAYMMAVDAVKREVAPDQERREVQEENDFAASECARFPDRLVPFLSVNPKRDYAIAEIDRCLDRWRMRGLKLHLWNSLVDTREPKQLEQVRQVIGHAAARGLPVLIHAFVGDVKNYGPDDTERLVKDVIEPLPALRVCFAHAVGAGGFGTATQQCLERAIALCGPATPLANRVWIDIAAVLFKRMPEATRQRFGELIRQWGLGRVLWGSDTFEGYLDEVRGAWPLSDADWETVCRNDGSAWLGA